MAQTPREAGNQLVRQIGEEVLGKAEKLVDGLDKEKVSRAFAALFYMDSMNILPDSKLINALLAEFLEVIREKNMTLHDAILLACDDDMANLDNFLNLLVIFVYALNTDKHEA